MNEKPILSRRSIDSELDFSNLEMLMIEEEAADDIIKVAEPITVLKKLKGRYQNWALVMLMAPLLAGCLVLHLLFSIGVTPSLLCLNEDIKEYYQCSIEEACSNGNFIVNDEADSANDLYELDLLCMPSYYFDAAMCSFFAGCGLGSLAAFVADVKGRRTAFVIYPAVLCLLYVLLAIAAPFFYSLLLLLIGVVVGLYYCASIVYLTELLIPELTASYVLLFHLSFPLTGILNEAMLNIFSSWRLIVTITALILLVILVYIRHVVESPCFLIAKENYEAASIAANVITKYNNGYTCTWEFDPEIGRDPIIQAANSNRNLFMHSILSHGSIKKSLARFVVIFLLIGFVFSGSILTQNASESNTIAFYVIESAIFLLMSFAAQAINSTKSLLFALSITGMSGIAVTVTSYIDQFTSQLFKSLLQISVSTSFMLAAAMVAESFPFRVRATGLGTCMGFSFASMVIGKLLLDHFSGLRLLTGLVPLCAIFFVIRKEEEEEEEGKELDEMEGGVFRVEGFCDAAGKRSELGIEAFKVSARGELYWEGKDRHGVYSVTGTIRNGHKFSILKEYNNGLQVNYEGERVSKIVVGNYDTEEEKGEFEFAFKARLWTGELQAETSNRRLEWVVVQSKNVVYGLGEIDDTAYFLAGRVQKDGRVNLLITTEKDSETSFDGEIREDIIQGKMSEFAVVLRPEHISS
eukprot:TRINITY_DN3398_c0_g2_i3.p1 TRINITY_DN3398_c0_g2~~TRINITY_DN3398_c0_g2_i3.p1  ORF type:complete len:694 (+),score=75.88 TRINITY_DN3398_c0_g2_i3:60-2141(+)